MVINVMVINESQLCGVGGFLRHRVEASSLGLTPGRWPDEIVVKTKTGAQVVFEHGTRMRDRNGEVVSVMYRARRVVLEVFND